MSDVQFQEDTLSSRPTYAVHGATHSGLTGLLIRTKVAKDEKEANTILIGIFILALAVTVFAIFSLIVPKNSKPHAPPITDFAQEPH